MQQNITGLILPYCVLVAFFVFGGTINFHETRLDWFESFVSERP